MLGHGQVQGSARSTDGVPAGDADEQPDPWLVERHEREVFPLLHRRAWFAEAHDFLLYDLMTDDGSVDESVLAYSNGSGPERSLVVYHVRFASTNGWIRESAPYARKGPGGTKQLVRRSIADGLGLPDDQAAFVAFRDARTGLESIRSSADLHRRGLHVRLDAYGAHVFWEFREIRDGVAGQWARLAARLGETAVPSLDDAMRELQLEPVHAPLRAVFAGGLVGAALDGGTREADLDELERRFRTFLAAVATATGVAGDPGIVAANVRARAAALLRPAGNRPDGVVTEGELARQDRTVLLGWIAFAQMGALAPAADVAATSRAWYDELRLRGPFAAGLRETGLDEGAAWSVADLVGVLLALPRPSAIGRPARTADARLVDAWLADSGIRTAMGINTWEGVEYLDRDRFETILRWASRLDAIEAGTDPTVDAPFVAKLAGVAAAAGYRVDALRERLAGPPVAPRAKRSAKPKPRTP
jgi:hypothetical protein